VVASFVVNFRPLIDLSGDNPEIVVHRGIIGMSEKVHSTSCSCRSQRDFDGCPECDAVCFDNRTCHLQKVEYQGSIRYIL
jgi:hypothetical protein